jgi:competence/damage-inducible protein CinA-like protein
MPILEIITIGTELLLGEITDTNSTYIARTLRDHGIDIFRITTIGDNPKRIAATIKEAFQRADIIITTGGLGPTIDDPTRQAVAEGTDRELVYLPELWEDIKIRFNTYHREPTNNNQRQAFIPKGAIPIKNPVGTAPSFIVEIQDSCVISLPGVPSEMKYLLHKEIIPYLVEKFSLKSQIIKATVLHTASIGESAIDEIIGDLEAMSNPTVGLLAHPGQVDIRVTAKAGSEAEAKEISQPVIDELIRRLGDHIYGMDEETLPWVVNKLLVQAKVKLLITEHGLFDHMRDLKQVFQTVPVTFETLHTPPKTLEELTEIVNTSTKPLQNEVRIGITLTRNPNVGLCLVYSDANHVIAKQKFYGGPPDYAPVWAYHIGLEFLRQQLIGINS